DERRGGRVLEIAGPNARGHYRCAQLEVGGAITRAVRLAHEHERGAVSEEEAPVALLAQVLRRARDPKDFLSGMGDEAEQLRPAEGDQHLAFDGARALPALPRRALAFARRRGAVEHLHAMAASRQGARQARERLLGPAQGLALRASAIKGDGVVDKDDVHGACLIGPPARLAKRNAMI